MRIPVPRAIVLASFLSAAPALAQLQPTPDPETTPDQEHLSSIPVDALIGDWKLQVGSRTCKLALFRDELSDGTRVVIPGEPGCRLPISRWSMDGDNLLLMDAADETLLTLTETDEDLWSSGEDMAGYTLTR